ncbi:unnamed protein product [Linum tenue]|uniref:Uncharacterized protein n=1 Tax=Linum tenue TaxID=586396 RepID=A0AAV0I3H2_9ROSI|nr:unnamed protein product [Linum tenue]
MINPQSGKISSSRSRSRRPKRRRCCSLFSSLGSSRRGDQLWHRRHSLLGSGVTLEWMLQQWNIVADRYLRYLICCIYRGQAQVRQFTQFLLSSIITILASPPKLLFYFIYFILL